MARTDDDTWDLATSVGATATGVAVGRALASRSVNPLIDDPFAAPLVRAVGVDFFTRLATGELDPAEVDGGAEWGMAQMAAMMAVRTKLIDDFFTDAAASGIRQPVILASGLDARAYRLGGRRGRRCTRSTNPKSSSSKPAPCRTSAPLRPLSAERWRSICARTGPQRCATRVLMPRSQRRGAPKAYWRFCRQTLRIGC